MVYPSANSAKVVLSFGIVERFFYICDIITA